MEPRGDPPSPATQEAEVARRIRETSAGNAQVVQENSKPDTTYEREWKRFKTFVDTGRAEKKLLPGDKYLTRQNVDLYFGLVVSKYAVVPDSARRVVSSLQWISNTYEHTLDKFEVESPEVLLALKAQMQHYGNKIAALIADPHANLPTDVLSDEDYDRAYDTILKRINWEDLHLSWTTCDQTCVRFGSFAKFKLADIRLDRAHGPPKDTGPGKKQMVSIILRPRGVHKDRYKNTKVVGSWRHKKVYRCSTGAIAMSLMVRFRNDPNLLSMNFYKNANGTVDWWKIPFRMRWNGKGKTADAAYRSVLNEADISWCTPPSQVWNGQGRNSRCC